MSPKVRTFFLASLGAVLVAFTGGCADTPVSAVSAPVAPSAAASGETELASASSLNILARFNKKPQVTIAWAKKWIGPAGGRLEFQGFAIDVPAGAVSKVTGFSIRLPVDPNGSEHVVAEFGPHNTRFAKPITISLPYRGTSIEGASSPTVVWWNNGTWVDVGGWLSADGARLSTYTDHFSEYGTTTARGGSMLVSGG